MLKKLKSIMFDDTLFFSVVIVLVGVVSFGLGRQSVLLVGGDRPGPAGPASIIFHEAPSGVPLVQTTAEQPVPSGQVIASRSGTKYHLPTCPGALQIKEENKIVFASAELARAAGYAPAANCPGL